MRAVYLSDESIVGLHAWDHPTHLLVIFPQESSQLIIAVDYTKSNEWTGKHSFGGRCLHDISPGAVNPYEQVISIVGRTLSSFDDDGLISAVGFGDATTQDSSVFSFFPGGHPAHGVEALQSRYRELTPHVKLAGPTSFAPAIYEAMKITAASGCQFHILILIADGQVTRPSDMPAGYMSRQEDATVKAIVSASSLPLSIIMVGVGDGPWEVMQEFDVSDEQLFEYKELFLTINMTMLSHSLTLFLTINMTMLSHSLTGQAPSEAVGQFPVCQLHKHPLQVPT